MKYLGITINSKLNWSEHIARITSKTSSVLGFLQRNFKKCPTDIKVSCYKSLVLPVLEYGCTIWDPYTNKDIRNLEKIQRRAARFILNDYKYSWHTSVSQLLHDVNLPSLQSQRSNSKAIMLYKIIHNLVYQPNSEFLTPPLPIITIIPYSYCTQELMPTCIPSSLQPSESGTV